jgi:hypothetical protein
MSQLEKYIQRLKDLTVDLEEATKAGDSVRVAAIVKESTSIMEDVMAVL